MAKVESKNKQNPKLQQSELKDGRASIWSFISVAPKLPGCKIPLR